MQLFPSSESLGSIAVNIPGSLPQTRNENTFIIVIKDRDLKLTKFIPASRTIASYIAIFFVDQWIVSYGVP